MHLCTCSSRSRFGSQLSSVNCNAPLEDAGRIRASRKETAGDNGHMWRPRRTFAVEAFTQQIGEQQDHTRRFHILKS